MYTHSRRILFTTKDNPHCGPDGPGVWLYGISLRGLPVLKFVPARLGENWQVTGEFCIQFHDRWGDFYCWLHTAYCDDKMVMHVQQFDHGPKRLSHCPNFLAEILVCSVGNEPPKLQVLRAKSAEAIAAQAAETAAKAAAAQAAAEASATAASAEKAAAASGEGSTGGGGEAARMSPLTDIVSYFRGQVPASVQARLASGTSAVAATRGSGGTTNSPLESSRDRDGSKGKSSDASSSGGGGGVAGLSSVLASAQDILAKGLGGLPEFSVQTMEEMIADDALYSLGGDSDEDDGEEPFAGAVDESLLEPPPDIIPAAVTPPSTAAVAAQPSSSVSSSKDVDVGKVKVIDAGNKGGGKGSKEAAGAEDAKQAPAAPASAAVAKAPTEQTKEDSKGDAARSDKATSKSAKVGIGKSEGGESDGAEKEQVGANAASENGKVVAGKGKGAPSSQAPQEAQEAPVRDTGGAAAQSVSEERSGGRQGEAEDGAAVSAAAVAEEVVLPVSDARDEEAAAGAASAAVSAREGQGEVMGAGDVLEVAVDHSGSKPPPSEDAEGFAEVPAGSAGALATKEEGGVGEVGGEAAGGATEVDGTAAGSNDVDNGDADKKKDAASAAGVAEGVPPPDSNPMATEQGAADEDVATSSQAESDPVAAESDGAAVAGNGSDTAATGTVDAVSAPSGAAGQAPEGRPSEADVELAVAKEGVDESASCNGAGEAREAAEVSNQEGDKDVGEEAQASVSEQEPEKGDVVAEDSAGVATPSTDDVIAAAEAASEPHVEATSPSEGESSAAGTGSQTAAAAVSGGKTLGSVPVTGGNLLANFNVDDISHEALQRVMGGGDDEPIPSGILGGDPMGVENDATFTLDSDDDDDL
eukprot:jgi/Mesvir1/19245/Mv03495-RA.1